MLGADPSKRKRRRGVVLTMQGLEKLQSAKAEAEFRDNRGQRYTLEGMSERANLAVDTLMKVFAREVGVDRQTLRQIFQAFNVALEEEDYTLPSDPLDASENGEVLFAEREPELPEGQVPLDSPFYVERSPVEAECYKTIMQPGALIRIKASRWMGKSSLIARVLQQAEQQGYKTVSLSLQLADREVFQSLTKFLQWFCASVGLGMQRPNRLEEYWDDLFGSKVSAKMYFEQYLLTETQEPLALGLDDVDRLFYYPQLASDFFGLLRSWHEEAKNRDVWKKLRLVVAHSTEVYIPIDINRSPFNVGLSVELQPFTVKQVQELIQNYRLSCSSQELEKLMGLLGGQAYLIKKALYHLWHQDVTLDQLLQNAIGPSGIYGEHLQYQLWKLQQSPELIPAFQNIVSAGEPVELDLLPAFKLQSMGLIHLEGTRARTSCELYTQYFRDRFKS